jgi:hypothetical protein
MRADTTVIEHNFDFSWENMNADSFAQFERLLGKSAFKVNDVYWRQVRPGFYRPLIQFKEYPTATTPLPRLAILGAAQHAVPQGERANSSLNCICFRDTARYTMATLDQNRNRQVRLALKQFEIRQVTSPDEVKRDGHLAYVSFFERTKYEYGSKRLDPLYFAKWVESLFQLSSVLVLGGYHEGKLVGLSVSFLVDRTVCYASFFCTTPALKSYLSDLMLHAVRSAAARHPTVDEVFAGLYKGDNGLDRFYLLRGAQCIRKPAVLRINPFVKAALHLAAPKMYLKMIGHLEPKSA